MTDEPAHHDLSRVLTLILERRTFTFGNNMHNIVVVVVVVVVVVE